MKFQSDEQRKAVMSKIKDSNIKRAGTQSISVSASDKKEFASERKGFFSNIASSFKQAREKHKKAHEEKLDRIEKEENQKLKRLSKELDVQEKQAEARKIKAEIQEKKIEAIGQHEKRIEDLRKAEKEIKQKIFARSKTGKALHIARAGFERLGEAEIKLAKRLSPYVKKAGQRIYREAQKSYSVPKYHKHHKVKRHKKYKRQRDDDYDLSF